MSNKFEYFEQTISKDDEANVEQFSDQVIWRYSDITFNPPALTIQTPNLTIKSDNTTILQFFILSHNTRSVTNPSIIVSFFDRDGNLIYNWNAGNFSYDCRTNRSFLANGAAPNLWNLSWKAKIEFSSSQYRDC